MTGPPAFLAAVQEFPNEVNHDKESIFCVEVFFAVIACHRLVQLRNGPIQE
jgi:hypothetical protein